MIGDETTVQNFDDDSYEKIGELLTDFFSEYAAKADTVSDEEFLRHALAGRLPTLSAEKIDGICREILDCNRAIKNFLDTAQAEPGYENATQNWFCEKIKQSLDTGDADYDFVQRLFQQNEILDAINHGALKISSDFQKLASTHGDKDDAGSMDAATVGYSEKKSVTSSPNAHHVAFNTGVKKSIMTQYKHMMQLDFANLNLRADLSTVATSLSRNAAMTGIGGMALTSGLSILFRSGAKRSLANMINAGTTDGLRVLVTGALKVGAERRMLPLLTRATPVITLTAVALVAVESSKTLVQYANGQIKCLEALNQVSKVSTAAICSVIFGVQGALVGAAAFAAVPIVAPAVGAFMGELVGTTVGYEVGRISYPNLKTLLANSVSILTADYGILDALTQNAVSIKVKRKKKVTA